MKIFFTLITLLLLLPLAKGQPVSPPKIKRISIDPNTQNVHIYWAPSTSTNVYFYSVFVLGKTGVNNPGLTGIPISGSEVFYTDSVKGEYHFEHNNPTIDDSSACYYVRAFTSDTIGSPESNKDSTLFLQSGFDPCNATIQLEWSDYSSWRGKIAHYSLYRSVNGGASYSIINQFEEGINEFTISQVNANDSIRYYIMAVNSITGDSAASNRKNIITSMAVIPAYIHAEYGTVSENKPNVRFTIDPASELNRFILMRAENATGPFDSIAGFETYEKVIEYTDNVDASLKPYYYRMKAQNFCLQDSRFSENTAGTIQLNVHVENNAGVLNWSPYEKWLGNVESYRIQRMLYGENYTEIASTTGNRFTDQSVVDLINSNIYSQVCYKVEAIEGAGNPHAIKSSSRSNEVCTSYDMNIRFEFNAFIPGSFDNGSFGPTIDYLPLAFSFKIFNRWGNLLFETSNPTSARWDGQYNGAKVPSGLYRYQLTYTNEEGKQVVLHGEVTVVYP